MENKQLIQKLSEAIEKSQSTIDDIEKHPEKTLGDSIDFSNCRNNNQWSGHTSIVQNEILLEGLGKHILKLGKGIANKAGTGIGKITGGSIGKAAGKAYKTAVSKLSPKLAPHRAEAASKTKEMKDLLNPNNYKNRKEASQAIKQFSQSLKGSKIHKESTRFNTHLNKNTDKLERKGRIVGGAIGGSAAVAGLTYGAHKLNQHIQKKKKQNNH